jgi:hypothetical protein
MKKILSTHSSAGDKKKVISFSANSPQKYIIKLKYTNYIPLSITITAKYNISQTNYNI